MNDQLFQDQCVVTATGVSLTVYEGDAGFVGSVNITVLQGQAATSAVGDATQTSSYALTGVSATVSPGNSKY